MTPPGKRPKVMLAINTAWNLYNFRAGLISALIEAGYDVVTTAPPDAFVGRLESLGCRFVPLPQNSHSTSIASELALLWRFWRVLRAEQPAAYLGYTIKPNTYGSLLAALRGVKVINNISGLGTAFLRGGWLSWLVQRIYWVGLRGSGKVFFQNPDDLELFVSRRMVRPAQAALLPGSGVNLQHFAPPSVDILQADTAGVSFILVARLVRDKGVTEFVEAARSLRGQFPKARFQLLGFVDAANPRGITAAELQAWVDEGVVEYLGGTDDVRPYLAAAHCVVLPSYREGTSRALLEAAAMGRPLVTTDVPGCRDAVDAGISGLLCQAKSAASLAEALQQFLLMPAAARGAMGAAGRRKMEREYDEQIVINAYLQELLKLGIRPLGLTAHEV